MSTTAEAKVLTPEPFILPSAMRKNSSSSESPAQPVFVPMLLLATTLVSWFGFQTMQLASERNELATIKANQTSEVDATVRIRASLDSLAASTQRLANSGNANAQLIVNELQKRGVTIKAR